MKVVKKTRAKRAGPGRANVISARAGPGRATFNYLRAGPGRDKQIFLKSGPGRATFQLRPGHGPDRPVSSLIWWFSIDPGKSCVSMKSVKD